MPNYNGTKRSLTFQLIKYENGVEVETTTYNGLLAFTHNAVNYPLITSAAMQAMSDFDYGTRLLAYEAYVGNIHGITVAAFIEEGYEASLPDGGMCPIPSDWRNITAIANVDAFGTATGAGTYLLGATCTIIATPASGKKFDYWSWTLGGIAQANITNATHQFVVSNDAAFTAVFSILVVTTFAVTFSGHVCQIVP